MLLGIEDGAELLNKLFLKMEEINISGIRFPVRSKNIDNHHNQVGFSHNLIEYKFETLWMPLNQVNYQKFRNLKDTNERKDMLNSILIGNILSFFQNLNIKLKENERLVVVSNLEEKSTRFKGNEMLAFAGSFTVNALLPSFLGLGKSVSRGFGTVKQR